jgi:hypothetical protein
MVADASGPKGFQGSVQRPAEEAPPRGGVTRVRVKRFNILVPRVRPAPDGDTSGGRQPTDRRRSNRRLARAPALPLDKGKTIMKPSKTLRSTLDSGSHINVRPQRELPNRACSGFSEPPPGSDALQGLDTHPGLLCCEWQR